MDPVLAALTKAAETELMPGGSSILVAVSGGADSMALLYGAAETMAAAQWRLAVAHVHHGWRGREADRDLSFVRDHARRLGLPFRWRARDAREEARRSKLSPEAAARQVRYCALSEMAREACAAWIATAHQREDRIESYLLARERRGGLARLAGPLRRRADGVVRPLLDVSRQDISAFLAHRGLSYRRDSSNGILRLPRNRVRLELTRLRAQRSDPTLSSLLEEIETLSREREQLETEFAEHVQPLIFHGPGSVVLDAARLANYSSPLQRRAIAEASAPFGPPGRPPLTGREREQLLARLAEGSDFRFEAGRRIRFERRGAILSVHCRAQAKSVYDSAAELSARPTG